ncbi:hypothetical protein JJP82_24575, partial [Enterobacter hormaechei]|nr:hypothetical protein [Enterobacter hormaechei]
MKKMTLNFKDGNIEIDGYSIELGSFENFTSSEFYKAHSESVVLSIKFRSISKTTTVR